MIHELQSLRDRAQRRHRLAFGALVLSASAFAYAMTTESSALIAASTLATIACAWWAEETKRSANLARDLLRTEIKVRSEMR